ncbi:NAD-dependent succinate-semialdehyde dehydrogenase [Limosilactobacillus fermentum]|uniref:NAD-dependent succinate-semialdehyde dehydrogenase n=1 Tax=Limosilactobacillus fermentum TaxID=1613 RepID=UPI002091D8CB|nr:NAD-dependent succinate-semialdehyde dehydrogenase [Limosilactobacillus fermentum]UVF13598.1 NAD-dependent succinate-semialdehyde dehydrogenase [Limosilactobacillus fermentum]
MAYQTVNPYTNEVEHTYADTTPEEVEKALTLAHGLYLKWHDGSGLEERKAVITKLGELLRERRTEMAELMTRDMGKLIGEAEGEVDLCASFCDYYVEHANEFLAPKPIYTPSGNAFILKQNLGVLMAVEPWNFPFYQIARVFIPNFIVGNPMLLKDAANCPTSAQAFADLVLEAGAPEGSLTNLFVSYDQVSKIIADPRVAGACLTGSERGGRSVATEAAKSLKKSTLELGGNDAFVVLEDADMDKLAEILPQTRLYNAGQVCTSSKRYIVPEKLVPQFVNILKDGFSKVKMGDPLDRSTTLAPLSSKKAKEKLTQQVQLAIDNGAKLEYGFEPVEDQEGQFFMPTILTGVTVENPIFDQEMFGPVAVIYPYKTEEEAIEIANNSSYGLGNTVFGTNIAHAREVASKIEAGMSWINAGWASLPEIPFGGVKHSGYGRELSEIGFTEFVNQHLIYEVEPTA